MRRSIISTLVSVAFLLMAFVSCQKETSVVSNETTIVFNSSRPQLESDTKTVWNGDKIQWSKGDAIRMAYTVDGIWQNAYGSVEEGADAKFYASTSTTISDDCQCATFMISGSFKGAVEGSHVFYALYPSSAYASSGTDVDPAEVKIEGPSTQTCSMSGDLGVLSFDSSADLMYGVSVGDYNARPASVDISWQRKVAHAYITLKDLAEVTDGEIVSSITLTANDGAALAGTYIMNLQDGTLTPSSTTNQVVINGTNLQISEGDIVFWACMMPCTWSAVTVVVETDKATYTREIDLSTNQKTFLQNRRNLLTINMETAERVLKDATTAYYEKVTSAPADWSGTYLIVCEDQNVALTGSGASASDIKTCKNVVISENKIGGSAGVDAISVSVIQNEESNYLIMTRSGYYIYATKSGAFSVSASQSTAKKYPISFSCVENKLLITLAGSDFAKYLSCYSENFGFYNTDPNEDGEDRYVPVQLYKRSEDL